MNRTTPLAPRPAAWIACALLSTTATLGHGGQPLATDDASIVGERTCQVEAWAQPQHEQRAYWLQPACNFGGNVELSIGAARMLADPAPRSTALVVQGKTVPFARTADGWSVGAAAGAARDTGAPHGRSAFQAYYARALASWYPSNDVEVDLNVGASNVYGAGTFALAGAALQVRASEQWQLLGELFRDEPGPTKYRAGLRWSIAPNRLESFVSYGNSFARASDRWVVIAGIRLQSPAFLP